MYNYVEFCTHQMYIRDMSKRLMELVEAFMIREKAAMGRLAVATGKDPATVRRWIKAGHIPDRHDRYQVAQACGCSEPEAFELAKDEGSQAKEKAS